MESPEQPGTSAMLGRMDRTLAGTFGAIVLALMLIAAGAASHLYIALNHQEEDRLAGAIARILDQAINKVAFSGKYHTRLLIEEMKATVPDLEFISVESADGMVIAHSDPSLNGTTLGPDQTRPIPTTGESAIRDRRVGGRLVKEVVVPYRSGAGGRALGIIRVGLHTETARQAQYRNLTRVLALIALLTAIAMWVVMLLSRRFGGAVRALAVQLQGITDSAQDGIIMVDPGGLISFWNPAAEMILGYAPAEAIGRDPHDLLAPGHDAAQRERVSEALRVPVQGAASGKTVELAVRRKDGREIAVSLSLSAVMLRGAWHTVGILRDITERKRAEEALQTSEVKLRSLFAAMRDVVIVADAEGRYVEIVPTATDLLYRPPDQLLGKTLAEVLPAELADRFMATIQEVLDHGSRRSLDYLMEIAGQPIWFSASISPYTPDSVLWVARDITERKKAEEALRESEEQFATVFREVPTVVGISTIAEGAYLSVNEAFERVFGYTPEEVIGRTSADLRLFPDDFDRNIIVEAIRAHGSARNLELQLRAKDGSLRDCLLSAIMIQFRNEPCLLVVVNDITDRKHLEAQLTQAQKMESVGRLAGGVAHDFNNMLGVILGHTEMALEQVGLDDPLHADLEEIEKAAARSADLTRQLLAFARKQTVTPKALNLNETVAGMLKLLRRLIGEDIELLWKPGHEVRPVNMDPAQIDQILANLCVNARDAITGGGKVTIETANASFDEDYCARHAGFTPGDYVQLAVSDDGCGMDADTASHIFEPFFTTKETGKGTGLGLATVYGAVTQNNGFVNVSSEPGQGTTFRIYLPCHAARMAPETEEARPPAAVRGGETILLVEDEPAILRMTTMLLQRLGYAVLAANAPGEAIRLAEAHAGRIDLLMTDVVMPEMNGRDLANALLAVYPDLRRLFMSGHTANVLAPHGVLDEGVHFIGKPYSMKAVAAKIREVLDE